MVVYHWQRLGTFACCDGWDSATVTLSPSTVCIGLFSFISFIWLPFRALEALQDMSQDNGNKTTERVFSTTSMQGKAAKKCRGERLKRQIHTLDSVGIKRFFGRALDRKNLPQTYSTAMGWYIAHQPFGLSRVDPPGMLGPMSPCSRESLSGFGRNEAMPGVSVKSYFPTTWWFQWQTGWAQPDIITQWNQSVVLKCSKVSRSQTATNQQRSYILYLIIFHFPFVTVNFW